MFRRCLSLILSASGKPVNDRDYRQVQEDTIHCLGTRKRFRCPADQPDAAPAAIRFCQGEAWTLLYLWVRCKHGWPGGEIEAEALANIENALESHFQPISEETRNV